MTAQGTSGLAVAAAGAGALLVWSGVRGIGLTGALRELMAGRQPSGAELYPLTNGQVAADTGGAGGAVLGSAASGSSISADALQYQGHAYLYGGAPGPQGRNPWDCSSFASFVLGHDLGMMIPGGSWATVTNNGNSHGPTTLSYLAWSRAQTVGHDPSAAEAGDLCVWPTHIGIATGGGQMISALNEQLGTRVTSIQAGAPFGEPLTVRRITSGVPSTTSSRAAQPGKTIPGGG